MVQIDWSKIRNAKDIDGIPDSVLFDQYESYAGGSTPLIRADLPEDDIEAAFRWLTVIPDMIGICLIIGEEGSGKSMIAHALSFDSKYLFNKLVVLDSPPRRAFGRYLPFSKEFLQEQLARIQEMANGNGKVTKDGKWMSSRGQVLLRHAVVNMDEFGSRWMSRLTSPMVEPKKTIISLASLNRHLQALFLGVGTELNDFDRHYFPHVDYIIGCERVDPPPYTADNIHVTGRIQKVKYDRDRDSFFPVGVPNWIAIDGSKPRDYLGGLAYKDIFHTDNVQAPTLSKGMRLEV